MSIDPKFVELTAAVLKIFVINKVVCSTTHTPEYELRPSDECNK